MEEIIPLIITFSIVILFCFWSHSRNKRHKDLLRISDYVSTKLYNFYLYPIESKIYKFDGDKEFIVLDINLIKNVISYFDEAYRILNAFQKKEWLNSENFFQQIKDPDKDVEYFLWDRMQQRFISGKKSSITGMDICNPFAAWVKALDSCVRGEGLQTQDIVEVQVCEHGDILFITSKNIFNKNPQTGGFQCNACKTPQHIFKLQEAS